MRVIVTDQFHEESKQLLEYFTENTCTIYRNKIYPPRVKVKGNDAIKFFQREKENTRNLIDRTMEYMESQGCNVYLECNEDGMCLVVWTTPEGIVEQKIYRF